MTAQCFKVSMETVNTTKYDGTLLYQYSQTQYIIQTLRGAIESVRINGVSVFSGLNLEKI